VINDKQIKIKENVIKMEKKLIAKSFYFLSALVGKIE
jgi:hypothetical protein